jgi:hypothetical protein
MRALGLIHCKGPELFCGNGVGVGVFTLSRWWGGAGLVHVGSMRWGRVIFCKLWLGVWWAWDCFDKRVYGE